MDDKTHGPGSAIIVVYMVMVIYGMLIGLGLGWYLWG